MWSPSIAHLKNVIDACEGPQIQKDLIKKELVPLLKKKGGLNLLRFRADFRWNLCSARMTLGDFSDYDGWEFRSNWSITYQGHNGKSFDVPKWNGKRIDHLVIMGEQGIGDEILYGSLIPELMVRLGPKSLEFQCQPRLKKIFERSFGIKCTDRKLLSDVKADATVALSDLMMWYRRDLSHFPKKPFLKPDPERVKYWRAELEKISDKPKIGIAWKSRHGEISPHSLIHGDSTFINLQYGELLESRIGKIWNIAPNPLDEIEDHINLIAALDKVVTVTQTVVHEAGSVGTPVDVIRPPKGSGETDSQLWYYPNGLHPVYPNVRVYDSMEDYERRSL